MTGAPLVRAVRRVLAIGARTGLALLLVTCVNDTATGPGQTGAARFSFAALAPAASGLPVPVDSLEIRLLRVADSSIALDSTFGFHTDTAKGDSAVVRLNVSLRSNPEDFFLTARAYGRGVTWYTLSATVRIGVGTTASPAPFTVKYVGTGANAAHLFLAPSDTTVVGGLAFPLRATVYDSFENVIGSVPVGYRLSDTTRASISYPTPYAGVFTGKQTVRDSVWVVAETPTHIKDSTRVHITPPAKALVKTSGDVQTSVVGSALPAPLIVQVQDALNGGFKGDTVRWTITQGNATLSAPFSVSNDTGYASIAVTPTAVGSITVQAAVSGLQGSPITFTESAISGTVNSVTITPKVDTVTPGATLQYSAVARDALGNPVSTTFGWLSTVPSVATVSATTGLATSVAGDSTRIIATAGGVADTARLYVRALKTLVVTPADTVITAVGDSLLLRTTAVDNFGGTMSGVNIRYTSASPGIAAVNAVTGRVKIMGPGNGVILARDSVASSDSLVRGSATLRVNQVTAGIVNAPRDTTSLIVGIGGQSQVVAVAVDSNGYAIPGKAFTWVTRPLGVTGGPIANVTSSGLVTGVALGTTYAVDTLVEGVSVFKDSTKIVVSSAPPRQILWTFDSTTVGNGGNISVGLTVTQPPATALTISIASTDSTIAKANPKSVVIGAGASGTSAVIYGLRAGAAVLTASDASGQGYNSRNMTVGVVSTITFREIANPGSQQQYFYLNQNETHKAQVWLSDPAPAGGLGVTFVYGYPGTSAVTPSPAVIPAGQLSADITLEGLTPRAGGGGQPDSVVPTSGGYIGRFSYVYVAPDSLKLNPAYPYNGLVGVGQWIQPYVTIRYAMDHRLIMSAALSAGRGSTAAADTIPTNGTSVYLTVNANAPGVDTLTVSAPGWVAASEGFTFTTPHLIASGTTSIIAGSPTDGYWSAGTGDSLRYQHPVIDSLPVTVVSRNPLAIVVDTPTTAYVPRNQSSVSRYGLRALATAGGDSSWIVTSAPGYAPDSFKVYVTKPTLSVATAYPYDGRLAVGTFFQNAGYVTIPYARSDTFWVVFSHTHQGAVTGPDSVRIPKGQTTSYFDLTGDSLSVDTMKVARATGYQVQGSPLVYTVDQIHVRPYSYNTNLFTISRNQYVNAVALDAVNGQIRPLVAPLAVTLLVTNNKAFTLDSTIVTIPAGQYLTSPDSLRVVSADSSRIVSSAPGSTDDSSSMIHVSPSPLTIALGYPYNGAVGRGLKLQGSYVYLPATAANSLTVTLQRYDRTRDSLNPATVVIAKNSSTSQSFEVIGLDSTGTDSITASAPGFVTARATITPIPVTIDVSALGANHLTSEPPQLGYVQAVTRQGYTQPAVVPITFSITSTDSTVIRIDSAGILLRGDSAIATIPANQSSLYYRLRYVGSGSARVRVAAAGFAPDSTELVTVSGPSLHFGYPTATVGVGEIFPNQYVYVDNAVTGTPLVVHLTRSDSLALPANQVFGLAADSVIINVGSSTSPAFDVVGQVAGSANLIARATGYGQATATVPVGQARLAASPKTMTLYVGATGTPVSISTTDQTGSGRLVAAATPVASASSAPAIAVSDSAVRTMPARSANTTFSLSGKQKGSAALVYSAANYKPDTTQVSVDTAQLALNGPPNGLGINQLGQMYVSVPFAVTAPVVVTLGSSNPNAVQVPSTVTIPTSSSYVYFNVTGAGIGSTALSATATGTFYAAQPVPMSTGQAVLYVSFPASVTAGQTYTLYVYAEDGNGTTRAVSQDLTVTLSSSDPLTTTFGTATLTIPAGSSNANTTVRFSQATTVVLTASAGAYTDGTVTTVAK